MTRTTTLALALVSVISSVPVGATRVDAQSTLDDISMRRDAATLDRIALGHLAASQLTLAEDAARRAIEASGDYAPAYNTLGLVQLRTGDPASARDSFVRARELDPTLFAAHMNEGALALDVRDHEAARMAFLHGTELRPRDYDAWISLGVSRRGLNDIEGARAAYERAQAIDASRPEAYFDLGLLFHMFSDGAEPALQRGNQAFDEFLRRAGRRPDLRAAVDVVLGRCDQDRARPRTHWRRCAGALYDPAPFAFMQEAATMQAEMARIQAQADAQAAWQATVDAFVGAATLSGER